MDRDHVFWSWAHLRDIQGKVMSTLSAGVGQTVGDWKGLYLEGVGLFAEMFAPKR